MNDINFSDLGYQYVVSVKPSNGTSTPTLDDVIIATVKQVLRDNRENQSKAARALGMSRGAFRKYMKLGE